MTFPEYWQANDLGANPAANYTVCEQVWTDAKRDLINFPCRRCGVSMVNVAEEGIHQRCPGCGWVPVEAMGLN